MTDEQLKIYSNTGLNWVNEIATELLELRCWHRNNIAIKLVNFDMSYFNDKLWIYRGDGEGMQLSDETLVKFEKLVEDFYNENF